MRLDRVSASKYLSPTIIVAGIGAVAVYFTYYRTRTFLVLAALVIVQAIVGFWRRRRGIYSWRLSMIRVLAVLCLAPTMYLDSYGVAWRNRIRFTLLGEVPQKITELKTYEDIWTDYVITMRFRADPESVRRILNGGKFERMRWADESRGFVFRPVKRNEKVLHRISVSKDYSEVFIEYAED